MTKTTSRSLLRIAACGLLAAALPALTGCGSSAGTISFRCGPAINGGLALAVDVIRATEEESRKISEMGEKWFYDQTRFNIQGQNRIQTVTFKTGEGAGSCDKSVTVPVSKGERYLVLIADYKFQNPDPTKQVIVLSREKWVGQKILVSVLERELSVERRW
ncbi:hypothetical protein EG835_08605 [bacterium]|nr:hypothetical protein [bacterium]